MTMTNLYRPLMRLMTMAACIAVLGLATRLADADPRSIETKYGPVQVDGTPTRIVTLYEGALDAAIASGAKPVGAIITRGGTSVAEYIQPLAGDIQIVGTPGETNMEAVIALQPDLILASARTNQQQYELLSAIAPTVVPDVTPYQSDSWIQETRLFARALGREAQGEAAIRKVRDRIAEVSKQVSANVPEGERNASVVRWMPQGALVMASGIFSATLVESVGFDVNDSDLVKEGRPHSHPLSEENLSMIDQSWLFLATLNADGQEALEAARRSPAFNRLQAVESGQVVPVDGQIWTSASGPLAAGEILDTLEAAVGR
ncbi:iron-siderophore ABC transporter substrate-binding protein [Marinobacter salarius]|uniref:ABC transporter substrate-binding protein n=1 Tax=Marinobacter TaxID=2742 RepID=UPI001D186E0B|nr:iron-siderophore ABC transporter substrate-binding protein [Marinobacter salarius]MCC4284157.1 iron-siderophore ABC transporter substrate-binding protein [Marinobacter salarius]MDP4534405.1 iron-siderophore ABC transporter substrate-binding protein [Marinobacter salarius]